MLLRACGGIFPGSPIQQLMERLVIIFLQLTEGTPACLVGRDGIILQPGAIGIEIKVLARLYGGIDVGRVKELPGFLSTGIFATIPAGCQRKEYRAGEQ